MKNVIELLYNNFLNSPNDLALSDDDRSLTYKDLYFEVLTKASYIRELGIYKEPVIVMASHTVDTIVSFFAILLSNNYYIPLDEDIPFHKLERIIELSHAKYIINPKEENNLISSLHFKKPNRVYEFKDFEKWFNEDNLSYLMFTSGSTGEPKGVIKNHKNIIAFVNNFTESFPFLVKERMMNQTPFFFDASAKDIYLFLKLGATLFIPKKTVFSLPLETVKYLNEKQISYVYWVPSILMMVAKTRTLSYMKPEYLKYVFFVGEVFQVKYLNMWIEALPNIRFFNTYGSTEVMGIVACYEIKGHYEKDAIPLGKGIKNNELELVEGEIVIHSPQVAKGYINPGLTGGFKGNDTFYTGDFATKDEEGNIVFLSRKDFQIKHLGYRIELQEIEANLTALEYIDTCCALYDEVKDRIALFASLNQELDNPVKRIISDAKDRLQFYMVPNVVIIKNEMPLNQNGKIDRMSLKKEITENGRN